VKAKRKDVKRKNENETEAKRAFRDFYKRMFTKKWMQPIPNDTEWHYPEDTSDAASSGDTMAVANLGRGS